MQGIYKIENIINHKIYIGRSNDIYTRFKRHKNDLKKHIHHNKHLQRSWDKYGPEAFEFSILELTENLDNRESYWINQLKTMDFKFGYNKTSGGENYHVSEETKQKLSKSLKGRHKSYEHKKNLWKNRSRKSSEETKKKISIAMQQRKELLIKQNKSWWTEEELKYFSNIKKGKKLSQKTKNKISLASKNRIVSEETKLKISKGNTGKKVSEETKMKISKANLGRKLTDDKKKSYWKLNDDFVLSIIDYLNKHPNQSINSIAKQFGVSRNTIYNIRDNKTYTHLKR